MVSISDEKYSCIKMKHAICHIRQFVPCKIYIYLGSDCQSQTPHDHLPYILTCYIIPYADIVKSWNLSLWKTTCQSITCLQINGLAAKGFGVDLDGPSLSVISMFHMARIMQNKSVMIAMHMCGAEEVCCRYTIRVIHCPYGTAQYKQLINVFLLKTCHEATELLILFMLFWLTGVIYIMDAVEDTADHVLKETGYHRKKEYVWRIVLV